MLIESVGGCGFEEILGGGAMGLEVTVTLIC